MRKCKVPDKYIRTRSDRDAVDSGFYWDAKAGQRVIDFIQNYVYPTRGFGADKRVKLLPWQRDDLIVPLFSWMRPDGTRRFREACIFVPRQNGKSFIAGSIAEYMFLADHEPGAYVVISACNSQQTRVIFDEVLNSVNECPAIRDAVVPRPSLNEIEYPKGKALLKGLSNEGWGKLGRPPHCFVGDEFAFWGDYRPYTALKTGTGSRRQPLLMTISTSGTDRTTPAYECWQYSEAVRTGAVSDKNFFGLIYTADPEDDITSPEVHRKANPSYGVVIPESYFTDWSKKAQHSKQEELRLRQFGLNQWCTSTNQFLNLDKWMDCKAKFWPNLEGKEAYLAFDLSTTTDLTSVVCVVVHEGMYYIEHRSFCCQVGVERSEAQNLVKYTLFQHEGVLDVHDGNSVDYEEVRSYIRQLCKKYKVKKITCDPSHNANDTLIIFTKEGLPIKPFGQGAVYFNGPMRRLGDLVNDGKVRHKGDSLINWQAQNLEGKADSMDRLRPTKPSQDVKIDTMVALIMAIGIAGQGQAEQTRRPTVYTGRGLRVL